MRAEMLSEYPSVHIKRSARSIDVDAEYSPAVLADHNEPPGSIAHGVAEQSQQGRETTFRAVALVGWLGAHSA